MNNEKKYTGLELFLACLLTACITASAVSITNVWLNREQDIDTFEEQYYEYWTDYRELQEKISNWELWDHGNEAVFHNDTNSLECEFWADGFVVIFFNTDDENVSISTGNWDKKAKVGKYQWQYDTISGLGTLMKFHIENNSRDTYELVVVYYREIDPFYGYCYDPLTWIFEVRT